MASKDFLKFNNGQKFSFSNFKEIKEVDLKNADAETKRLFNIFAGDGVLDAKEAQNLWDKLKSAAATNKSGDNSVFDNDEMQNFLDTNEDLNSTLNSSKFSIETLTNLITQIFTKQKVQETDTQTQVTLPDIPQSKEALTEQELQQVAVQTLNDDAANARALFDKQNREQGSVSNASNWVKELFSTEYAKTQVDRVLMIDDFSAFLIKKASTPEGITKREYYEAKIEFITQLVKKFYNSMDEANLEATRKALKKLSPNRINIIVQSIATLTDNCTPQDIVDNVKELISIGFKTPSPQSNKINLQGEKIVRNLPDEPSEESLADMESSGTLSDKMEFEEVFFAERRVSYNKEAINNYALKNAQFGILSKMRNTVSLIDTVFNEIASDQKNEVSLEKNQTDMLNNLISSIYGENILRAKVDLADNGLSFELQDGKISVFQNGFPLKNIKAISLLVKLKQIHQERFKKALGNKTFEEYASETTEAYKKAYGNSNVSRIVNNYIESQGKALGWMKTGATYTGMTLMIAGDLLPVPAGKALKVLGTVGKVTMSTGGLLTATFGSAGLSYLESSSKAGGMTEEDKKEILEEVKNSILLTASGMVIGKVAHSVAQTVAQTCPKLLALASEIGIDGAMSLVADLAITGEIDCSSEGIAQLTNILVGILRARGVKNFMNDYSPKRKPVNQTENIKNNIPDCNIDTLIKTLQEQGIKVEQHKNGMQNNGRLKYTKDNIEYILNYSDGRIIAGRAGSADSNTPFKRYKTNNDGTFTEISIDKYFDLLEDANFQHLRRVNPDAYNTIINFEKALQSRISVFELREYLDKMGLTKPNHEFNFSYGGKAYNLKTDNNGNVIGFSIRDIITMNCHYFIYDSKGKAIQIDYDKYNEKLHVGKSKQVAVLLYEMEQKKDLRQNIIAHGNLEAEVPRFNERFIQEITSLIKTPEDEKLVNILISAKTTLSKKGLNEYVLNSQEILNIMKSPQAKNVIMEKINNNEPISRTDIEKTDKNLLTSTSSYKRSDRRDLTHEIKDLDNDPKLLIRAYKENKDLFNSQIVPPGEVICARGQLLCNTGDKLVPINLTKEKFMELFPTKDRFEINQGRLGDCWLVTSFGALMDSPKGRAAIYSMFRQDGNDIYIKFPDSNVELGFENGDVNSLMQRSIYIDNKKLKIGRGDAEVQAYKGIRLLERAYSIHRLDGYQKDVTTQMVTDIFFMNKQMQRLESGSPADAIANIVGRGKYIANSYSDHNEIIKQIEENVNNPNKILTFGTKENGDNSSYDLYGDHAYHIVDYNKETGMISISNPWHNNKIQEIPIYEWLSYIGYFGVTELK